MDNKIKHISSSQSIPSMEFKPLLRGESPYYGNLNRPSQSAYDLANTVALIQSWSGFVSIVNPGDINHEFVLYEIARLDNDGLLYEATDTDDANSRYGIVVAEAEFDQLTSTSTNIVVCTFCPNFIYPTEIFDTADPGESLFLDTGEAPYFLSETASGLVVRPLAKKTGTHSIFFSGTATLW